MLHGVDEVPDGGKYESVRGSEKEPVGTILDSTVCLTRQEFTLLLPPGFLTTQAKYPPGRRINVETFDSPETNLRGETVETPDACLVLVPYAQLE